MVKIIPESELLLPFTGAGTRAEKKALDFLKLLPYGYYVLRECKINPSSIKQSRGSREDRLDLVVVGPAIGIVVLEIKDWDISNNRYEYINGYEVRQTDRNGTSKILRNPYDQVDEYVRATAEALKNQHVANRLWVSGFVVYPRLTRTDFENKVTGLQRGNPNQRFIFDSGRTLFLDDFKNDPDALLKLLQQRAENDAKAYRRSLGTYTEQQVNDTVDRLVPSEMRVGGLPDDSDAEKTLAFLDSQQQAWALNGNLTGKTYLSDVAGSGKTNVLLSRAVYWAKQHITTGGCLILVATYSKALRIELERIFQAKIADDPYYSYYNSRIHIYDIASLMEEIVKAGIGSRSFETWRAQLLPSLSENEYIEDVLLEKCIDFPHKDKKRFQIYDYLLIDEVQDFSTWFLEVAMSLLKNRENIFTVGDVGQKLFDRELEWGEFDIVRQRVEIPSRFLMYRSPQPVAKLAWKFLTSDPFIRQDLEEEGYKTDINPKSRFIHKPVFIPHSTEEELLQGVYDDIQDLLYTTPVKRILCIGSKQGMLGRLHHALTSAAIPVRWATEADSRHGDYLILADYIDSKGLERDYVYILDADCLAGKMGPFASEELVQKKMERDRIKLFVALTRAIREVRLYYTDRDHTFIKELLQIQSTL